MCGNGGDSEGAKEGMRFWAKGVGWGCLWGWWVGIASGWMWRAVVIICMYG